LYDYDNTPKITSITPSTWSVVGGDTVLLIGNLLDQITSDSFLDSGFKILEKNETHLAIRTRASPPGLYQLRINIFDLGYVEVKQQIIYEFFISNIFPRIGSIRGGTLLTVKGGGFSSDCQSNQVSFGSRRFPCKVLNCTSSMLTCQTSDVYETYDISNSGTHSVYGLGYAWTREYLKINKGDSVSWRWVAPIGMGENIKYRVIQVANPVSTEMIGFNSGGATVSGSFTHMFNSPGVYYYWSGFVEASETISFRGIIEVIESDEKELEVDVNQSGMSAQKCVFPFIYNEVSYDKCINTTVGYFWCSPTQQFNGQRINCLNDDEDLLEYADCNNRSSTISRYHVKFSTCLMPTISGLSLQKISYDDLLIVFGTGLNISGTQASVLIGRDKFKCAIVERTDGELICRLGENSELLANIEYEILVHIENIGYALQKDKLTVKFVPKLIDLSVLSGSIAGGSHLVINGDGFRPEVTIVRIGNGVYQNGSGASVSFNKIVIPNLIGQSHGKYSVEVFVNNMKAENANQTVTQTESNNNSSTEQSNSNSRLLKRRSLVDSLSQFEFFFSDELTPVINSVNPSVINSSTSLIISGSLFGSDISQISIKIGPENCQVKNVTDTEISCVVHSLPSGNHSITVTKSDIGNAQGSIYLTSLVNVLSIEPNSGSIYGGALVTIIGNGFDADTEIFIGNHSCVKVITNSGSIQCRTGDSSISFAGTSLLQTIELKSNDSIYSSSVGYRYSQLLTPILKGATLELSKLILNGSSFGNSTSDINVNIGSYNCSVQTVTDTEVVCEASQSLIAGVKSVRLYRAGVGYSNSDVNLTVPLVVYSLSSNEGSIGGGKWLKINGSGLSNETRVKICGKDCLAGTFSSGILECLVPSSNITNVDTDCVVAVGEDNLNVGDFTYRVSLTPRVISVEPGRGGTGGGTLLKINGSSFGINSTLLRVTIEDSECVVESVVDTEITCRTGEYLKSSVKAQVKVEIIDNGLALNVKEYE